MNDRKGITPVIATSLLILIAVSAVATAAVFLGNTTDDITGTVNDRLSEQERIDGTSISIERGFNNSNGNITLEVRNTGSYVVLVEESDQKYWSLFENGKPRSFNYTSYSPSDDDISLDAGEKITLETNVDYPTGPFVRLELEGRYEVESGIICSNDGGSQSC